MLDKSQYYMVTYYLRLRVLAHSGGFWYGEMSERFKEPVLKTGDVKASVGSNPTLSATISSFAEVPKRPKGLPC